MDPVLPEREAGSWLFADTLFVPLMVLGVGQPTLLLPDTPLPRLLSCSVWVTRQTASRDASQLPQHYLQVPVGGTMAGFQRSPARPRHVLVLGSVGAFPDSE